MSSSLGEGVPHLRVAEAANATFSAALVESLFRKLRLALLEALEPLSSTDSTEDNPVLQKPNHLRELRFYQTGLVQLNFLAKSERSKIAVLCLDMMPGLLHPSSASPEYTVSTGGFTYSLLLDTLGLKTHHETIYVRSTLFSAFSA